jgi:Type II secretion system (T2SS), protein E, N-terminal domain
VSSSDLPPYGEAGPLRPPDTDEGTAAHPDGSPKVSPELALVDPALASTEGDPNKEVTMSSNAPENGTFFVDQQPAASAPAPAPTAPAPAELQPAPAPATRGAMFDVPLGTLIFRAGLLAEEQLEDALQEGMRTGKRLGEVLTERGLIKEPDLGRLLAGQRGLPFVELEGVQVDPTAVQLLPEEIARMQHALTIGFEQGVPVVVVADPTNELVVENVRRALGKDPHLVVAAQGDIARKIDQAYAAPAPAAAPVEPAPVAEAPPVAAPEALSPASAPVAQPAPEPQAPPEQPAIVPTPMPTVVPPPEERAPEAQPVVEATSSPAPEEVPPLLAQPVADLAPPVVAVEPVAAPAPAASTEPAPVVVAPVEQSAETGLFTQAAEQAIAPLAADPPSAVPAAEPPPAPPAAETPPAPPAAETPPAPPAAETPPAAPADDVQVVVPQPETLAQPEAAPAPAPAESPEPASVPTHFVVLRLNGSEPVEIGGFASQDEAESFARTVVGRISRAEEQAEWPFFAGRFIRPQTIVSVDVVEQPVSSWTGSPMRSRWDSPSA